MDDSNVAIGERFLGAINARDWDGMLACLAEGARVWHSNDRLWVEPAAVVAGARGLADAVPDFAWKVEGLTGTESGFVAQGILSGTSAGVAWEVPVCAVARVDAGRIGQVEEYIDGTHFPRRA